MSKQSRKSPADGSAARSYTLILASYSGLLLLFFLASFFPEARLWGINWWAYFSLPVKLMLLAVGVIAAIALRSLVRRLPVSPGQDGRTTIESSWIWRTLLAVLLILAAGFILFPSTTHFLGDGYQLLVLLSQGGASIKAWDFGATSLNRWIFNSLSGEPLERAYLAFRIVSSAFGFLLLGCVVLLSRRVFSDGLKATLFRLSVITGGYVLQFFGYVENYAGLILAITVYSIVGLLAAERKISYWWAALPLAVALFFHLFAVSLLPSFVFLMAERSPRLRGYLRLSMRTWRFVILALAAAGAGAYYVLYHSSYFFTFALLPLWPDRFTVDHDWLLSPKHVADVVNLLLLLAPGIPILLAGLSAAKSRSESASTTTWYFRILAACTLATVWVFNPGIGMPRNWDLFSIVGPPVVVYGAWAVLARAKVRPAALATSLAVVASLLLLGPRVASQASDRIAIAHFRSYIQLDPVRSRNGWSLLVDYYKSKGDSASAETERSRAEAAHPESTYGKKGRQLTEQAKFTEAVPYLRRALEYNPIFCDAYISLGVCYLSLGGLDSARVLTEIANGLNPYNADILSNLGTIQMRLKHPMEAEDYYRQALRVDSTALTAVAGMASIYVGLKRFEESMRYLQQMFRMPDIPATFFKQAADAYASNGASSYATQAYQMAVARGLDTAAISDLQRTRQESKP